MKTDLEVKPWWKLMREELLSRQKTCKSKYGPHNEYILPKGVKNPYRQFKAVQQFREKYPMTTKHLGDHCKIIRNVVPNTKDKYGRYYIHPKHKEQCDLLRGFWDANSINRMNKYDQGVCWTSDKERTCGTQAVTEMLRPFDVRNNPLVKPNLKKAKEHCEKNKQCSYVQPGKYSHDCLSKEKASLVPSDKPVLNPPEAMPSNNRDNMEKFLYDWYVGKKHGARPKTARLMGTGNRCAPQSVVGDKTVVASAASSSSPIPDLTKLDPLEMSDVEVLRKYGVPFDVIKTLRYRQFQITHGRMNPRYFPDPRQLLEPYMIRLEDQDDVEIDDEDEDDVQGIFKPSMPQSIVNMVMKNIAKHPDSTDRGMLAWHSLGSGKTCAATGVIEAFWDTKRQIIFASSIDAIASNPDFKFHECAVKFFPRFQQAKMDDVAVAFKERDVRFLSFAKLSNRVKKTEEWKKTRKGKKPVRDDWVDLDNAVLIIDEVHNLFRPLATQKAQHQYLEKHLVDPKVHPALKMVILTATPGDNIADVTKLLNMVRDSSKPAIVSPNINDPQDISRFKNAIRGIVSFFDMSHDYSKFPRVVDEETPIAYPMSKKQLDKYIEAYKSVKDEHKDYDKLAKKNQTAKYWQAARKYSNMLFNFDKNMALSDFSAKMPALLENIKEKPNEKHYVYSGFYENRGYGGQGILAIAKQLDAIGYTKMTYKEADAYLKKNSTPPPGKRYVLAISNEIGEQGSASAGKNLAKLVQMYNHPANSRGQFIQVFLASQGFNEGLDLKATRHIHFFEPLVNMASDKQTVGRAARYCSHQDLPQEEWTVDVHRYISDVPVKNEFKQYNTVNAEDSVQSLEARLDTLSEELKLLPRSKKFASDREALKSQVDAVKGQLKERKAALKRQKKANDDNVANIEQLIFDESRERIKELLIVYQAMKEAAVDCQVLRDFHGQTIKSAVNCAF
jgi:hypothetical protein